MLFLFLCVEVLLHLKTILGPCQRSPIGYQCQNGQKINWDVNDTGQNNEMRLCKISFGIIKLIEYSSQDRKKCSHCCYGRRRRHRRRHRRRNVYCSNWQRTKKKEARIA